MEKVNCYTVLGRKARIIANNLKGDRPLAVVIEIEVGTEILVQLSATGRYYESGYSAWDIILHCPDKQEIADYRKAINETIHKHDLAFVRRMLEEAV